MNRESIPLQDVIDAIAALRAEVRELRDRMVALEASTAKATHPTAARREERTDAERLSEELVLTISAAIAAYLGVRPRIRQIRLLGDASWAQQGRATIQASHAFSLRRDRSTL